MRPASPGRAPAWKADLWLVSAAVIWGTTFVVIKDAVGTGTVHINPVLFLAIRFGLGTLAFAVTFHRRAWPGRLELAWGALIGILLFAGNVFQTVGLETVSAARSAFLTSLTVVFVPLLGIALWRRAPSLRIWVGVVLAVTGLTVLYWTAAGISLTRGDLLTLACALVFSGQMIGINAAGARGARPLPLCGVQLAVGALGMCALLPFAGDGRYAVAEIAPRVWAGIAFLATVATVIPFAIQATFQPRMSPARAGLIFTMEPVFATLTAAAVTGVWLTGQEMLGSGLILSGTVLAELRRSRDEG